MCASALLSAATTPNDPAALERPRRARRHLSPRERDVLSARMAGALVKDVASDLGLAIGSIAELQRRALEKFHFSSLEEAVEMSENFLELFRQTPDGTAPTISPRLTREDLRE